MSESHLLSVWAFDKEGEKVYPYKGRTGLKKGLYSVNFTSNTAKFQGMSETDLRTAIKAGRFRERGTVRMCRVNSSSGSNAFAPLFFDGALVKSI